MADEPVSEWLHALKRGDQYAATLLWGYYYKQLKHIAFAKLKNTQRRVADEEDVAALAMAAFFERANVYPQLENRDDLWNLLVTITERKAFNQIRHQNRLKRGGGKTRGDSVFIGLKTDDISPGPDQFAASTPTPELQAIMTENFEGLLAALSEKERAVAMLRFDGHTNAEIAREIGASERSVNRALVDIREKWRAKLQPESNENGNS